MNGAERDRIRRSMELLQKAAPRATTELVPYERNQKDHSPHQVEQIAVSLRRFGWRQPIVVDGRGVIVIGHGRWMAAKKLGLETVPVVDAADLTADEIRELRIIDNRLNESPWNDFLAEDLQELTFEGFSFPEDEPDPEDAQDDDRPDGSEFFNREEKDGAERQEGNDEYNEFLEKFEAKKTTDDCYTPDNIYQAVAGWVAKRYALDASNFVRPFFPGGDYQNHHYPPGSVVVDNPPFSIMAQIVDFYLEKRIPFFLFAPSLASFNYLNRPGLTVVAIYATITYENKATVKTSFLTNMEGEGVAAFPDCELFRILEEVNDANEAEMHVSLPKYEYPPEVLTAAKMGYLCQYGQELVIRRDESLLIGAMDAQKEQGKTIFGHGLLLSQQKAAERAAATRWQLSEREQAIVEQLSKGREVTAS